MKRLKLYLLFFCLALCLPLSFVIWRTYAGVAQEELGQLRFFAETRLDEMEQELAELVRREEGRSVEEYGHSLAPVDQGAQPSPLADPPRETFILGYLQNNPDGSLQTPLVADLRQVPASRRALVDRLQEANRIFNQKKYALLSGAEPEKPAPVLEKKEAPRQKGFADRYLATSPGKLAKESLGQKSVRVEELTPGQAANIAKDEGWRSTESADAARMASSMGEREESARTRQEQAPAPAPPAMAAGAAPAVQLPVTEAQSRFQVEIAPLQSVFIDDQRVFIFRRVVINDRILRQGFVLQLVPFLEHLARTHFDPHPMANFTRLHLSVSRPSQFEDPAPEAGPVVAARTFPAPFNFMHAAVSGSGAPPSPARRLLNAALIALVAIMILGLLAIYQSVQTVVDLSERRSQFVSAVTHELKTPLTNIRMYVEMLEQGIAATPEREQTYLGIIGSESARLSRLINNVLELSRLEKKQRQVNMQPGRLEEVLAEVRAVMAPKLAQEGFELIVQADSLLEFAFDREALLQILINLVENSIKFGRTASQRRITISARIEGEEARIAVADTGPGIAKGALKKVFDDFYRADNALTRTTSGTGIGLALVRKLTQAMGGRVAAANNAGSGCTITVSLPFNARGSA
ncbi:MAG: HAMP domain-containing histidine kinase [Desulfobacterales bacterium]|nr:HAMP domain-containing histidine kinase [Desulfobacterales bacterium]